MKNKVSKICILMFHHRLDTKAKRSFAPLVIQHNHESTSIRKT